MQFTINPFTHRLDAFEQDIPGGSDIETLTGDSGGAVPPTGGNVNILGGPGIDVIGTPGTSTLTIKLNGAIEGTGQTIGAVTADLITLPLGAAPGVYLFKVDIVGFDRTTPLGVSYFLTGCVRTTGAAATEISNQVTDDFEEGVLIAGAVDLIANANNAIIRVTGTAGKTIDWIAVLTYTFRG